MKMHFCTARVNLSGQGFHIVKFEQTDPISWPEAQVLMALHGEENVMDVKPCAVTEANPVDEKFRLIGKYGRVVEAVFPGRTFRMETLMPGENERQPHVDGDGVAIGTMNGDDDEDDAVVREPPTSGAVFKPGKHMPPRPLVPTEG
jgi:hypothetical protein